MSLDSKLQQNSKKNTKRLGLTPTFFIIEGVVFLSAQFLGLYIASRIYEVVEVQEMLAEQSVSIVNFLIIFFIGTAALFILTKIIKRKGIFGFLFYLMIFFGSLIFFDSFLPIYLTLLLAITVPLLRYFLPNILTQNIAIVISIIGASVYLGLGLSSLQVIILLVVLSVYDFIAVHKTGHMVSMFKNLASKGALFSLVIPSKFKNLGAKIKTKEIKSSGEFMFLGTGDIAFPLIFAVSLLKENIWSSFFIIGGAFLGVNLIYFYFLITKKRKAVAALPPIAFGSIIGYLISLLLV